MARKKKEKEKEKAQVQAQVPAAASGGQPGPSKQAELPGMPEGKLRTLAQGYLYQREQTKAAKEKEVEARRLLTNFMKEQKTIQFRTQDPDGAFVVISIKSGKDSVSVSKVREKTRRF